MREVIVCTVAIALLGCSGCKPEATLLDTPAQERTGPMSVRVHSFAQNEVRLIIRPNSSRTALIEANRAPGDFELELVENQETWLILKATENGFVVKSPLDNIRKQYTNLSNLVFLTPPLCVNDTLVVGTWSNTAGILRAIRVSGGGPTHKAEFELPPMVHYGGDLLAYKLHCLPPVRDMRDALTEIRSQTEKRPYSLSIPQRKAAGRNYRSEAFYATTMWPPNASKYAAYMLTIATPADPINFWQIFLIDPTTEDIFLIRDRTTGDLIPLQEWLDLDEKTCIYSLEEALAGVCDDYQSALLERDRKLRKADADDCQSSTNQPSPSLFPDDITGDAHAICAKADKSSGEIPSVYWPDRIKALNPIKVYTHRVNVVVVQRLSDGTEEGKYIYIPISSYLPRSGDDAFTFARTETNGVYDYRRSRPEHNATTRTGP